MVWTSGWRLASAVSNAGGLGLIGSGSMYPEILKMHIQKCREATDKPFGVNIPLIYPYAEKHMELIVKEGVSIVFTSAGNPDSWTPYLKSHQITVVHVVSGSRQAVKSENAGVDAIVAEGFEAGGHNGREETTTMVLIPAVCHAVSKPVIAAGGIGSGRAMLAAFALGAEGVQIGSRFAASIEGSAHPLFKQAIVDAGEGDTLLTLKKLLPVRMLKNAFFKLVQQGENQGASETELLELLGKARAKKGMFDGQLDEGELEIGQVSALIRDILPASDILRNIWEEFCTVKKQLSLLK